MLSLNPLFKDFVTGAKRGSGDFFFCRVCKRDVKMGSHGSSEIIRHYESKKHWEQDVVYRLHMCLPIYNKLMEPMTLSSRQEADFRSRPFVDLGPEFPFPEDLLPTHAKVDSKMSFMTLVSCFCDWLRSGGDFSLVQRLWGHFLATLGEREPEFTLKWSRSETAVSMLPCFVFPSLVLLLYLGRVSVVYWCWGVLWIFFASVFIFVGVRVSRCCSASVACDLEWCICLRCLRHPVREGHGGGKLLRCLLGGWVSQKGVHRQ